MNTEKKWLPANQAPDDVIVFTKIDDGTIRNEQKLRRRGSLWFYPDMSMYVYYTPTHFAYIQ